jgi:hypothetical protein
VTLEADGNTETTKPHCLSSEDFEFICSTYKIPDDQRSDLKSFLTGLVDFVATEIQRGEKTFDRKDDRKSIKAAREAIQNTRLTLEGIGPSGKLALRGFGDTLGEIVDTYWLRGAFPDDGLVPSPRRHTFVGNRDLERPGLQRPNLPLPNTRDEELRTDETDKTQSNSDDLYARVYFARHRTAPLICAILRRLEKGLKASITDLDAQPGARGGRKSKKMRHLFLLNLVSFWASIGRRATSGDSKFADFCESVFDAAGWPTRGVKGALPAAIEDWRNRSRKSKRLRK